MQIDLQARILLGTWGHIMAQDSISVTDLSNRLGTTDSYMAIPKGKLAIESGFNFQL